MGINRVYYIRRLLFVREAVAKSLLGMTAFCMLFEHANVNRAHKLLLANVANSVHTSGISF